MKIFEILDRSQKRLFANLSLFLAISFFFAAIFFGLDFTDSFYHLNQALHPAGDQHLYPFLGSSLIIKEIVGLLGPEIIFLRLTNSFLLLISFLLPFLILKPQLSRNKMLIYMSCGLILFLPFTVNILGYDTLSIFFLSLIFTVSVDHLQTPRFFKLLILIILCAAAILIRLPNILVLPIIFIWFLIIRSACPKTLLYRWQALIFLLLSLLGIALVYAWYYGSWNSFINASANANSHLITQLFQNYLRDGIQLFFFLSFILFTYCLFQRIRERISKVSSYFFLIIILLIFMSNYLLPTKYIFNYSLFIFAVVLSYTGIQIFHWKKKPALQPQIFVLYFLFLFINLFGSNTGLLKGYSMFVLFPFVFSMGHSVAKTYWSILFLVLIPFSFVNKLYGIYEDKNLLSLDAVPGHELLSHIRTSESRVQYLDAIDAEVKELRSRDIEIYFYGDKSHIFHYLYPETVFIHNSFYQPFNETAFLKKIEKAMSERDNIAIFMVSSYPVNSTSSTGLFEQNIQREGFQKIEDGSMNYYLKTSHH